jgi:hypothetical protein
MKIDFNTNFAILPAALTRAALGSNPRDLRAFGRHCHNLPARIESCGPIPCRYPGIV